MNTALASLDDETFQTEWDDLGLMDIGLSKLLCEQSLYEYVKQAWPLVEPLQPFIENWHIEELCRALEQCYYGRIKRLIANVPPGTAKSLIINVFFPTWVWAKNARKRFLCASFSASLTTRDNLRARQLIESPWYHERWDVTLADDQNAKTRYNTQQKGWRIATSVNGQGMGEHPDFILIDDPTSASEAESDTERQNANDWFDRTISQRLGRNPCIIVIMQRLHTEDLSGHLLARGGWEHIRWPMRFEVCSCPTDTNGPLSPEQLCPLHKADQTWQPDKRDRRTTPGELLIPKLFDEQNVRDRELNLGTYGAAGQLQQRPSPEGGGLFKREWFKYADIAPKLMRVLRAYDTAATEGGGDYTATVKIGEEFETVLIPAAGMQKSKEELRSTGRFYILDAHHDQLGPDGVDKLFLANAASDGKAIPIREEREGGASGKAVISARTKLLRGYDFKEVTLGANKVVRAKPFRAQCEAGNVYLMRAAWNAAYVSELTAFPTGAHDDWVDASSCAFNSVLMEEPPKKVSIVWGAR